MIPTEPGLVPEEPKPVLTEPPAEGEFEQWTIPKSLDWEKRSGATFEADKTAIIHFAPKAHKVDQDPFTIN